MNETVPFNETKKFAKLLNIKQTRNNSTFNEASKQSDSLNDDKRKILEFSVVLGVSIWN